MTKDRLWLAFCIQITGLFVMGVIVWLLDRGDVTNNSMISIYWLNIK